MDISYSVGKNWVKLQCSFIEETLWETHMKILLDVYFFNLHFLVLFY